MMPFGGRNKSRVGRTRDGADSSGRSSDTDQQGGVLGDRSNRDLIDPDRSKLFDVFYTRTGCAEKFERSRSVL